MADKKISALTSAAAPLAGTEVLPIVQNGTTVKVSAENLVRTVQPSGTAYQVVYLDSGKKIANATGIYTNGTQLGVGTTSPAGACTISNGGAYGIEFDVSNQFITSYDRNASAWSRIFFRASDYTFNLSGSNNALTIANTGNVTVGSGNLVIGISGKGIDFSATGQAGGMTSELLADYEEGTWTPGQGAGLTVVGAFSSSGKYTKVGRVVTLTGYIAGATSVAFAANAVIITGLPYTADTANGKPVGVGANAANSAISGIEATNTALNGVVSLAATTRFDFTITYTI